MLSIIINKQTNKATVNFNGKDEELNVVTVNKAGVKPGTHWVNLQKLGTPRKWQTVNYNDYNDDIFTIEVDETACRVITKKVSRVITLTNIKDYLSDESKELFDKLMEEAAAKRDEIVEAEKANAPVKEKKSRAMTPEEKLAKKLAEIEELKKIISGEIPAPAPKARKKAEAVVEDLDASDTTDAE